MDLVKELSPMASDEASLRQPPPYPGLAKVWQQQVSCPSFSSNEAGMDLLPSSENLMFASRQEPQGEENIGILQGFGDGNPPLGGYDEGNPWMSTSDPNIHKTSPNSSTVVDDVGASMHCVSSDPAQGLRVMSQSSNNVMTTGTSLLSYPSNSLISQLLLCSTESTHLRNLLQDRFVRANSATEAVPTEMRSAEKRDETCQTRQSPGAPSVESERFPGEQFVQPSATVAMETSKNYEETEKAATGSPKLRAGHAGKSSNGSPTGGAENRCVKSAYGAMQATASGSTMVQQRSGIPVRDLQRPATAPSVQQLGAALSEVRISTNNLRDSCKDLSSKTPPCVGSHPDLNCLVEVTTSHGVLQQFPAKVVTSIRGRELMRLSSYSTVQQQHPQPQPQQPPSQYLLPMPKQSQQPPHQNGQERQQSKSHNLNSQKKHLPELDHAAIATRATEMVERLSEENQALRRELKSYYKKVSTLEKVEREIQRVSDAYDVLVLHSQKRENLEKLLRFKLEAEIRNLNEINKQLKEQLERNLYQLQHKQGYSTPDSELRRQLHRQDALIAKLIVQNQELISAKERLEREAAMQRSTMEDQLKRMGMLENALANAPMNAGGCDEELERHQPENQGSADIQMALAQLHLLAEKRESADQRLGTKIEDDFHIQRSQQCDTDDGISSDSETPTSIHSLIRQMQEKERRILQLETEVAKWEQKFLNETILRQLAVDAVTAPKIRNLQAELAEKDMLIKILQRHASLSRSSSVSSLLLPSSSSPVPSPHHRSPTNQTYMMAMSVPASGATSRQSSQVDDDQVYVCASREPEQHPLHIKSSSANSAMSSSYCGSMELPSQYHASPQVMSYGSSQSLQSGSDQVKRCFWQV